MCFSDWIKSAQTVQCITAALLCTWLQVRMHIRPKRINTIFTKISSVPNIRLTSLYKIQIWWLTSVCCFTTQLAGNIRRQWISRLPNREGLLQTSATLRFPLRTKLVVRMISAMLCPETNCFSHKRLSVVITQLSPSLTQYPADLRVVQAWIHNWNFSTFYLQVKQTQSTYIISDINIY